MARRCQQERNGDVGRRIGEHIGRVADGDPPPPGFRQVDVVDAYRIVAHHLQLRPGGIEHLGIDRVREQRHDARTA